jgi:glycerol kinase
MGCRKTGKLLGRESAFSGEKLEWLLQFEEDFRTMERGAFYDMVVKKFLT